ncbi:uncharacterized protein LOC129313154 [Prosopis cineraria]|uniref:uncharacterized protein LOC129313154 n=1 Tax=Prosopis cineraria TaxID=364024 RepID=UPI0024103C69|nr:uncharacterized protein LOC129313154 [Prosopis cineraria]
MGGGGAMRTAMKVAGLGVANASLRGVPLSPVAGQSVMKASVPASAAMSSQGVKASAAEMAAPVNTAALWDTDDWEFADTGDLVMEAGEPMPRVVFNAVPSFQEAKVATTELKEAIDQIYLSSSPADNHDVSSDGSRVSVQSPHSELEIKSCEPELVPKHALQAFQFLSASSEAQTVVASIVSDPNVWTAIMQNSMLNDFIQSQEKVAGSEPKKSYIKLEELPDSDDETRSPRNGFLHGFNGLMQNFKHTVAELISSVSSYFHNLFGFSSPEKTGPDSAEKANTFFTDHSTMKGTFMGLAVLVALVVLFKRA